MSDVSFQLHQQGYRVIYREAHTLLEELADATLDGTRKAYLADLAAVPLLIIDDLSMPKLPHTAAEDLLEAIMRRYERAATLLTSNRPVDDWGKLRGDTAAVTALLAGRRTAGTVAPPSPSPSLVRWTGGEGSYHGRARAPGATVNLSCHAGSRRRRRLRSIGRHRVHTDRPLVRGGARRHPRPSCRAPVEAADRLQALLPPPERISHSVQGLAISSPGDSEKICRRDCGIT